jgi:phenylacetate-CoA ligase
MDIQVRSTAEEFRMAFASKLAAVSSLVALPLHIARRKREQWLTVAKLAQLRDQRLRSVLKNAQAGSYYQRVLPRLPGGMTTVQLVEQLPILDKQILSAEGIDAFLTKGRDGLLSITTSGSTGEPAVFLRSPAEEAEFSARWWRVWAAYGGVPRDRLLNVGRTNTGPRSGAVTMMRKMGLLPKVENISVSEPVAEGVRRLCEFQPRLITGFAIGIEALAEYILQHDIKVPASKVVICSAMDVTDHCRDLVHRAFRAPAVNVYATNEFGVVAWECPVRRGVLHINDDMFVLEVLKGDEAVPDGTEGEIVLTSLTLTRMPLLRFRTGDVAARLADRCPCGRGLACMTAVQGRTAHSIRGSGGRLITAPLLASAFGACGAYDWVRRFQVREQENGVLCALVVPKRPPDEMERRTLLRQLHEVSGGEFTIELELRDELPLAPTGKFQYVVPLPDVLPYARRAIHSRRE